MKENLKPSEYPKELRYIGLMLGDSKKIHTESYIHTGGESYGH